MKKKKKEDVQFKVMVNPDSTLSIDAELLENPHIRDTFFLFSLLKAKILRRKLTNIEKD
jgi:hypothetical protein